MGKRYRYQYPNRITALQLRSQPRGLPQNSGRILIIVGDPGLNETTADGRRVRHNEGDNFDRAGATKKKLLEEQGYTVILERASSFADVNRFMNSNGMPDGWNT